MVADGILKISTVVELLNTDSMNIDYEHLLYLWDYCYVLEIGEYTQKKISLQTVSITFYPMVET